VRISHYLRANSSSETIHELVIVDTETDSELDADGAERAYLRFGWACYVRRIRGGAWSAPQWFRFDEPRQLWSWVAAIARPKTKLYVIAHNWGFDALVTRMFDCLPDDDWRMENACIDGPPIIIKWRRKDKTLVILDSLNWWRDKLANLTAAAGLSKLRMPKPTASRARWDAYCRRDVRVVLRMITRWADFLQSNDLGGFAPTLASQSLRTFRHRYMTHRILIDDNPAALEMARESYTGGRVECFRIGLLPSPTYILDVNSMYPSVMRDFDYPTKLVSVQTICTPAELRTLCRRYCVVAEVSCEIDAPCLPIKREGMLIFPIGRLRGTWSTPDLLLAFKHGTIAKVHRVAIYEKAPIFEAFSNDVWRQRQLARAAGDAIRTHQWKILGNSLYGKFGQRGRRWEDIERVSSGEVKVWDEYDADANKWVHYRQLSGVVQKREEEGESRDSHPAIASHVTANARSVLWGHALRVGFKHLHYMDTDSLWTDTTGYNILKPIIDADSLGSLKLEATKNSVTVYGPKDYERDGERKIKGIRGDARELEKGVFVQAAWRGMAGAMRDGDLQAPKITGVIKILARNYRKGVVSSDGSVAPFVLAMW
jgi:hypothetical protein